MPLTTTIRESNIIDSHHMPGDLRQLQNEVGRCLEGMMGDGEYIAEMPNTLDDTIDIVKINHVMCLN